MDSMRSLNTSLPRSPRRRRSNPPHEQLIQTFKAAALSVTNLYKTAATDQAQARKAGYQDALDDILSFLDKENLGLGDGEGWKVRQWATERLDGSPLPHGGSDTDDDRDESSNQVRSSSPMNQRSVPHNPGQPDQVPRSTSPSQPVPSDNVPPTSIEQPNTTTHDPEIFSFRSPPVHPQDYDMNSPDRSTSIMQPETQNQGQNSSSSPSVRLEVVPRTSRTPHRGTRHPTRAAGVPRSLGAGAGSKRVFRFGDYEFDFGGPGEAREGTGGGAGGGGGGGGKRGRFV